MQTRPVKSGIWLVLNFGLGGHVWLRVVGTYLQSPSITARLVGVVREDLERCEKKRDCTYFAGPSYIPPGDVARDAFPEA